ncbi:TQXA domain protein [Pseudoflavonifractor capillosus ATCC 29799]|uniref:TQXA domain protein n=1 Tax=Pseudoflavonifractor capillosus ATCC 29799 TaxID=411467 RepID=A6P0B4_9FIRM|nr:SpaA isopeptide-forming pilin-related protein [Pseudoflavonifractor capillosus]EDM98264.1 TQXA domain protein [Pseudoflavonifractor capillosus ATCC 29799]
MKKLLSLFLACILLLGILPTSVFAADSVEEALGEVNIYNGDYELGYLSINGAVKKQTYTYFLYESNDGTTKESPAYCVNPTTPGVPQSVGPGESIKYLAEEKASDPKVVGIISNGYPHRSLGELNLDNKYQAYYATKMALWCYLLPNWNIANLKVAPGLTGSELDIGNRILAAAKDIYKRGTTYNYMLSPRMTVTADKSTAYPVTIDGQAYLQQVFTVWSETWVYDYDVTVSFSDPGSVPDGTKIVDANNNEITAVTTQPTSDGYAGTFKVLYPASSVEGQSGNVQLSLSAPVAQYAAMYAVCQEKDKYGELQNYICDLDNNVRLDVAAISSYANGGEPGPDETALKIVKLEEGTELPLEGAVFSIYDPEGRKVGSFSTGPDGTVVIPLTLEGHYTVTEEIPPQYHLLPEERTQHADVEYDKTATLTFWNAPYGSLRVEKRSDTGDALSGVTIQIKHIETGETRTGQTNNGVIVFDELAPGGWEVRELAGIEGWIADTDTVQTVAVVTGEESTATIINQELPGLRITKYERGSMELMPNVSFEIFRDAESLGIFQTDEFGQILLTNCQPGTYRVEERNTGGDSHVLDTTPQEVELEAGDGIKDLVFFNDRLPGIHLIKVDSSDLSQPIANARFRFEAVDGSFGPEEYTTSEDGTIDLSKLPVGTYVVTELECPGYVVDDAQRIIHLDGGDQAQFVFTNSKLPSLHLYKESADGTPLGGVTYRLSKIEDGSRYLDRITSSTGEITWDGLEPGVYSLQEVTTVSDHILDPTEYHVQLFPGKDATICLQNDKRPNLTIWKHDADTGAPVPGTVFLVKGADGHSVAEVTTGPDGSATVSNLMPEVYEVIEKSVPSPYLPDADPQLVTLYPNRDRDVHFENHKRPTVTIQKESSVTHDPIQYAEFHITWSSNKTETGEQRDLGTFQTDEAGQIILDGIEDGWLTIKETKPAPGYQLPDDPVTEVYVKGGENKTVTIPNTPLSALVVYKQDSVTGAGISGCRFQLKYLGGEVSGSGGTVIGTYTTSANGSFTVTGLKKGYYICEEMESDSGHVIDAAPQSFYISGEDQDIVTLYFSNAPKGAILVKKVSSADNSPLSDVEFLVTKSDGSVVGDANGKFVTDSTGTFLVEGVEPGTTLIIKETRAKPGYLLDDTPQTVQVKEGQTVTVEFRNQPMGNLIIHKLSSKDKTPLEGVQFKITYADGTYLPDEGGKLSSNGLYWTNAEGQIVLSGITGIVVVTEVESIPGYIIDPNTQSQTVVVNPDDTQELWFYNSPVGGVEFTKVNEADKTETISGVTFEIRRVSDDALVDTVTTGKDGKVFLPLEAGDYYAQETKAADGFKLDDTPIYFTVKDGETTRKTVTNKAFSGILLHKIDADTRKGIYGVTFLLYDGNMNPVDQFTTDQNGYAYIDTLDLSGKVYLRELENEGYIVDEQLKTVYIKPGETTEITWENRAITGQIQIVKKSADYNPTNGLPAGTLLEGAVFEIYDKAGNLVDTIRSDSRGLAVSKPLPLSRYTIREVKAPANYGVNETELTAYLEHEGQIVKFEVTNKSLTTGVSITKTGPKEIMAGQPVRYTFSGIANTSNVRLDSFYWRDTLPAEVRLDTVVTGTYNFPGTYKITYRVNGGEYRTLADNLSTSKNYTLAASATALGLASNERVTEVMFVFGQAPAGFAQVEKPYLHCTAVANLASTSFVNVADVGGVYNGQWVQAISRWVTTVYGKPVIPTLPRTGY